MQRRLPQNGDLDVKKVDRRVALTMQPFDPPLSPPPTSPLPPLPEAAFRSDRTPTSAHSTTSFPARTDRPIRPPRPQVSLPELKPRIMKSPETYQRQRCSLFTAQTRSSPTPSERRRRTLENRNQQSSIPDHPPLTWLPMPKQQDASTFSDDVLGALPRLLNRFPSVSSSPDKYGDKSEAWRVYHRSPVKHSRRAAASQKAIRKSVARSALFIPRTPPERLPASNDRRLPSETCNLKAEESSYTVQMRQTTHSAGGSASLGGSPPIRQQSVHRVSNKRPPAVTSFSFDFGNYYAPDSLPRSSDASEDLTSLPPVPSDPILLTSNANVKLRDRSVASLLFRLPGYGKPQQEAVTFAVVPYSHTLQTAGPAPNVENGDKFRYANTVMTEGTGVEEVGQLTEEEIRVLKQKRILWAVATIFLVVVATCGILIGIIWKLRSLD